MRSMLAAGVLCLTSLATANPGDDWDDVRYKYWPAEDRDAWRAVEDELAAIPTGESLARMHELLAQDPHPAGSRGDALTVDRIADLMESFGLQVERHPIWVYLSRPVDARLEIIEPERVELPLMERPVQGDPDTASEDLDIGWNAYSGSGDVVGQVVYANYARQEDFKKLEELGVGVTGKIVIARYGKLFRGYKAKYAEEAGAIGLILYTDPEDSGYGKGHPYPRGGYANETSIQRGGLKTLNYPGDPLTPRKEAEEDAIRRSEYEVELPTIPVQPIGWGAARQILARMDGEVAPADWMGGLPFPYALEGGPDVRVRLMVEQAREIVRTWNVIGTLEGTSDYEQEILVGSHHDAWGFGAGDPLAGTICMLEAARTFGEMAERGHPPLRTIRFCAWAAEEHGLIGSTEYFESRQHFMNMRGVAYLNLDMSAMGPDFHAMASPSLRTVIAEAAHDVAQAGQSGRSVYEAWIERGKDPNLPGQPRFGHVGGGSDHVSFWGKAGMPVAGFGGGGAKGTSYHTAYDTLAWYRKVVGDDYEPALMITRVTNLVLARLANAPLVPLDPRRVLTECRAASAELAKMGMDKGFFAEPNGIVDRGMPMAPEMARLASAAASGEATATRGYAYVLERVGSGEISADLMQKLSQSMMAAERVWLYPRGIPGRDWYTQMFSLPDETVGYGASVFPWLRTAIRREDMSMFVEGEIKLLGAIVQAAQTVMRAEDALRKDEAGIEFQTVEQPPVPDDG